MAKYKGISPAAVIFKVYPDAFWNAANAIVRVQTISSLDGDRRDKMTKYVLEQIAGLITKEKNRVEAHHREAQHRRRFSEERTEHDESENDNSFIDDIFDGAEVLMEEGEEEGDQPVKARNINFIMIDAQASVRTKIFPRTFHCKSCGHFVAFDPAHPPATLGCPCCNQGQLVQEPIVFGCVKCANMRELVPKGARISATVRKTQNIKDFLGGAPPCPDCLIGHIHLEKHNTNSIQYWQWYCSNCKTYREDLQESCLNCYIPQGDANQPKQIMAMNAFPASASNALKPLIDVQMFVRDDPLDPSSLHIAAQEASQRWSDYFELQQTSSLSKEYREQIERACIANAYLLNGVRVITTVYGYRAGGIMNHGRNSIDEDERLARFFPDPEKFADYVCYGMMNEGAALVLELDKKLILERLAERYQGLTGMTYGQILREERSVLSLVPLKKLLQYQDNQFPLITALHGMEHAILTSASRCIGNEVLGSKLFLDAGVLLLYEREPIGRGGVIQVVNGGPGLHALVIAAGDHVAGCAQGCVDGCPGCIYVPDTHCQYRSEEFGRTWLPANTLLSRTGARQLLLPDWTL